jgi:hypothetical protein
MKEGDFNAEKNLIRSAVSEHYVAHSYEIQRWLTV